MLLKYTTFIRTIGVERGEEVGGVGEEKGWGRKRGGGRKGVVSRNCGHFIGPVPLIYFRSTKLAI